MPPPPEQQIIPEPAPPAPDPPPAQADDLTAFKGIGLATQKRLHVAGFTSYARLADANPEELRRALGNMGHIAKVEDWIRQARELVAKPSEG